MLVVGHGQVADLPAQGRVSGGQGRHGTLAGAGGPFHDADFPGPREQGENRLFGGAIVDRLGGVQGAGEGQVDVAQEQVRVVDLP